MILKIRPFTYRTYIRWVFLRVTKLAKIRNMYCIFNLRQYFIGDLKYFLQKILQNKISAYSKKLRFKRYREKAKIRSSRKLPDIHVRHFKCRKIILLPHPFNKVLTLLLYKAQAIIYSLNNSALAIIKKIPPINI